MLTIYLADIMKIEKMSVVKKGGRAMARNNGPVINKEKDMVKKMIALYCRKKHGHEGELCNQCGDLESYALTRLSFCPFGEEKSACSNCKVHCYKDSYRQLIKLVMRYSGPRMLLYHPFYSIGHVFKK